MKMTPLQRKAEYKTRRKTGDDLQGFLVKRRNEGRTLDEIAKELDVSRGSVVIWLAKFGVRQSYTADGQGPVEQKEAVSAAG